MQCRVNALSTFGNGLVRNPNDLGHDPPGRDHDLNFDRNTLNALKCNRADACDHAPIPCAATHYTTV